MISLSLALSLMATIPSTVSMSFANVLEYSTSEEDIAVIEQYDIDSWDDYANYLSNQQLIKRSKNDGDGDSISKAITNPKEHLNTKYPNYYWTKNSEALTSDVTNNIPVEMKGELFPMDDIREAVEIAGLSDKTNYGGCGPIAALGIMDYFSRYLGYKEIMSNPFDSKDRVELAAEFLSSVYISIFGNSDNTLVWPWDCTNCFNYIIGKHGLSEIIHASYDFTLFGWQKDNYWNKIVQNIDQGMPVTLFTGLLCGDGAFSRHYTNIYGYETWTGIPSDGGDTLTKKFIKARLNFNRNYDNYCDADILDCGQLGLITYSVNYANKLTFNASDFSEEYTNSSGMGQYYFYNINQSVSLTCGEILQTSRLRTSYIENQYLVLSPNRANAGTAYLDITFPNSLSKLTFTASIWSGQEGTINENFKLQYYDDGWKDHISISPLRLSTSKDYPNNLMVIFPKNTNRIRFYATHNNPSGSRNKGRIVLDNFNLEYN